MDTNESPFAIVVGQGETWRESSHVEYKGEQSLQSVALAKSH
jgi:hypothetical protein